MRLILITILALIAFAANSILVRIALEHEQIGPGAFAAVRLLSGAMMLGVLVALRGGVRGMIGHGSAYSATALFVYAVAFSFAYVTLDTGTGALILFGGVQVTMFFGAVVMGERPSRARWIGALVGLSGLAIMFGPTAGKPDLLGALLMSISALGWGVYSLLGRRVSVPLEATAANFLIAAPFGLLVWWLFPVGAEISRSGVLLAVASGALASGIGYAIWYSVLPQLKSTTAAIVQLSVPVIALGGGVILLGEALTWAFALSAPLIILGVLIAIRR